MTCNGTVTIVNIQYDSEKRKNSYSVQIIDNASIYNKTKSTVGDSGLLSANEYYIRFPRTDVKVNRGDICILKEVAISDDMTEKQIRALGENFRILDYSINNRGCLRHTRINGS